MFTTHKGTSKATIIISSITLLLLITGIAGAIAPRLYSSVFSTSFFGAPVIAQAVPAATDAVVGSGITYQGRLTDPAGNRLTGTYPMRFAIYNAVTGGALVWESAEIDVAVEDGLFTVVLDVDDTAFNGIERWLTIVVDGQTLAPRQEILPAPYALSLRPGAESNSSELAPTEAIFSGYANATGAALRGTALGGAAIVGDSVNSYGVWGTSENSWGGYFGSEEGYGLRVSTNGKDHYDHGAYITSNGGYAVYAQSANNQAVRGEAGDITGLAQPIGPVGVAGMGSNRGVYGSSGNGAGVYGASNSNYGLWGQSSTYRGITGRTNRADNNYGIYTPDNLFANSVTTSGSMMQVMQNNGPTALTPGDVVVFNGVTQLAQLDDAPLAQVSAATTANSAAVAGVVVSRFNPNALEPEISEVATASTADLDTTPPGDAAPGDYVLVAVQGIAQVKVDQVAAQDITPGTLLATGNARGSATQATTVSMNGIDTTIPGTVFAKALETPASDQELIYVYVTLQ